MNANEHQDCLNEIDSLAAEVKALQQRLAHCEAQLAKVTRERDQARESLRGHVEQQCGCEHDGNTVTDTCAMHEEWLAGKIAALQQRLSDCETALASAKTERDELQATFDLRWKADMRAIARWRAEKPEERDLRQPDHADMVVWLMEQLEAHERKGND